MNRYWEGLPLSGRIMNPSSVIEVPKTYSVSFPDILAGNHNPCQSLGVISTTGKQSISDWRVSPVVPVYIAFLLYKNTHIPHSCSYMAHNWRVGKRRANRRFERRGCISWCCEQIFAGRLVGGLYLMSPIKPPLISASWLTHCRRGLAGGVGGRAMIRNRNYLKVPSYPSFVYSR